MADEKSLTQDGVVNTPEEAFRAIDADSARAGGPWVAPEGYEGSIGSTMFDAPTSKDGTVTVLLPPENIDKLPSRSEEHTSELQSQSNLVCRLLLEKKKNKKY